MLDHPTTDESTIGDSRSVDSILDDSTTDHSILYVYRIPYTRLDAYLNSDDFPCFNHASQNCFVLQLFHFHALRKARKISPVFNCSSASNFWGSLAECFFYKWWLSTTVWTADDSRSGVLATDNSATATDDSRKTMTWERHHAALPVCPRAWRHPIPRFLSFL